MTYFAIYQLEDIEKFTVKQLSEGEEENYKQSRFHLDMQFKIRKFATEEDAVKYLNDNYGKAEIDPKYLWSTTVTAFGSRELSDKEKAELYESNFQTAWENAGSLVGEDYTLPTGSVVKKSMVPRKLSMAFRSLCIRLLISLVGTQAPTK